MTSRYLLIAFILSTHLSVLTAQTFTSPAGYEGTEGNRNHGYVLGSVDGLRFQQVDATHRGTPIADIGEIAFRRDAVLPNNLNYGSRTLHGLTVVMAHSSISTLSTDLDRNYLDTPVVVFGPRDVTAPDWIVGPGTSPAPFDFVLTLDVPFSYNGSDDLLWEVRVQSVSPPPTALLNYPFDFQENAGSLMTSTLGGTFLGDGCLADGHTTKTFVLGVELSNQSGQFLIKHSVNYGPPSTMVWTFLGLSDPDQPLPGLCTRLRTDPLFTLSLGQTSSTGSVAAQTLVAPYAPEAVGLDLFLQSIAIDNTQPGLRLALTQGVQIAIPADPSLTQIAHGFSYPAPSGSLFSKIELGGIVARFTH